MTRSLDHSEIVELLTALDRPELMERFLQDLLTPQELEELSQRWRVVKLLHAGLPQREIAKRLGISIGTVSRGARELKYGHSGFNQVLQEMDQLES